MIFTKKKIPTDIIFQYESSINFKAYSNRAKGMIFFLFFFF